MTFPLQSLFEGRLRADELLAAIGVVRSAEDYAALAELGGRWARTDPQRITWMADVLSSKPQSRSAAIAVLRGAVGAFTECAYCDAPILIRFLRMLGDLYSVVGDLANTIGTHEAVVREATAAKELIFRGYPREEEFMVKFPAIEGDPDELQWSYWLDEENSVTVHVGTIMSAGTGPLQATLARGIYLTMLNLQLAISFSSIARAHEASRKPMLALDALEKGANLDRGIENWLNLGATLNDLGNLWSRLGSASESHRSYREALAAHRIAGNGSGIANALTNLARWELDRTASKFSPLQALRRLLEALPLHRAAQSGYEIEARRGIMAALELMRIGVDPAADVAAFLAQHQEELQSVTEAPQKLHGPPLLSPHRLTAIVERQELVRALVDPEEVLDAADAFIDDISAMTPAALTEPDQFLALLDRFREVAECGIRAALSIGSLRKALDLVERKKNRTILRDLYFNTDPEAEALLRTLDAEREWMSEDAAAVERNPSALRIREEAVRRTVRIQNLNSSLQNSPLAKRAFPVSTTDLHADFLHHVSAHDRTAVLVDFFSLDDREHVIVATADHISVSPGGGSGLAELRRMIGALPQEAHAAMTAADTLFVAGHGDIHFAPLSVLFPGKVIARAYSLDLLSAAMSRRKQQSPRRALVVNTLDSNASKDETKYVAAVLRKLCKDGVVVLTPADALVDKVCEELAQADIAHIIAHGDVSRDVPLESALLLSDGRLTADAIGRLRLRNLQFLFLNACSPGRSAPVRTDARDDEFGIVCSFFATGATSIVAPVKQVGDSIASKRAMEFYGELTSEHVVGHAMRVIVERGESGYALFGSPYVRI